MKGAKFWAVVFCIVLPVTSFFADENSLPPQNSIERYYEAQPFFARGMSLLSEGKYEEAIGHFSDAHTKCPEHSEASLYIGLCLYQTGAYEEALTRIEVAKLLYPRWYTVL